MPAAPIGGGVKPKHRGEYGLLRFARSDVYLTRTRTLMRWILAAFYAAAGRVHLNAPDAFLPIVPDWVPFPRDVVLLTGVCELAGAAGLMTARLRKAAGVMLGLYAICVFPANLKHAFYEVQVPGLPTTWWYHAPRLAMQPVLVWWALFCSGAIAWPGRRSEGEVVR
jgi:uncharacterized membrane protein